MENQEEENPQEKSHKLDHQLDIANQKILFKMLDYLISARHSHSVEINNCNSDREAIDKITLRINHLENRIAVLKQQYESLSQLNNQTLNDSFIKNQELILKKINLFKSEKSDLEMQIPKSEAERSYVCSCIDRYNDKIQASKNSNNVLKQINETTLNNLNSIHNAGDYKSNIIEQDNQQVNNFDSFLQFIEAEINK